LRCSAVSCVILGLLLTGCSSEPTRPEDPSQIVYVDESPAWSPVGDSIAYHRGVWSGDGSPGVYLVHLSGSGTRLIVADDGDWISQLEFSPDGTQLAGTRNGQLVVISVADGAVAEPFHTENLVSRPEWSPDQSRIVLNRNAWYPPESPDSAGVQIYDFSTNRCEPLIHSSPNPTWGEDPTWSPDGTTIAFIKDGELWLAQADGTGLRQIVGVQGGEILSTPRWIENGQRILYEHLFDGTYTTWVTTVDGTVRGRWPFRLGDSEGISPDGQQIVVRSGQRDGTTLYVLLYRRSLYGQASESLIPVTHYAPGGSIRSGRPLQ